MKTERSDKQRRAKPAETKSERSVCGTLSYLAQCRGAARRGEVLDRPAPVNIATRFERRMFPAR